MLRNLMVLAFLMMSSVAYAQTTVNTTTDSTSDVTTEGRTIVISPPPSAISPSVGSSSSDLCMAGVSGAVQTQILGVSTGEFVRDENCERLKISKTLYDMGMKVAAVSILCQDVRVFDSMWSAGTFCPSPISSKIGIEAKQEWLDNKHLIPKGSFLLDQKEITVEDKKANDEFKKFIFYAMAMYIGIPILF